MLLNTFDIFSDFYSDPELKLLFKEEHDAQIPSSTMWALVLNVHPRSKFAELDTFTREQIIKKDYLNDLEFNFSEYKDTSDKILSYLPTTADRFLATWNKKLNEINSFLDSVTYNSETAEMLSKIMKEFHPMMKQYKEIVKEFQKEQELQTLGGVEESLLEKGLLLS